MVYEDTTEILAEDSSKKVDVIIKRYKEAEALKDNWKEATGETLSWLSVVKHSTGPVGDLVKWLQEPTDAPDADKFKLLKT